MWQIIALIQSTVQLTGWRYIHSSHSQGKGQIRISIAGGIVHLYCYLSVSEIHSCSYIGCVGLRAAGKIEGAVRFPVHQICTKVVQQWNQDNLLAASCTWVKCCLFFFFPGESFLFSSSAFRHRNDWKQKHLLKGKIIHSLNWIEILSTLIFFMQGKVKSKFQTTLGNHFLHIICSHGFIYNISFGGLWAHREIVWCEHHPRLRVKPVSLEEDGSCSASVIWFTPEFKCHNS